MSAVLATRPIFLDWPGVVPAPDQAVDRVYAAFSDLRRPAGSFCSQCFSSEREAEILRPVPVRQARVEDFAAIYYDNIDCSVGAVGFGYFLPRALETVFLRNDFCADFADKMIDCGVFFASARRRVAVKDVIACGLMSLARTGNPAPLGGLDPAGDDYSKTEAALVSLKALLALRVEPRQLFTWCVATGGWVLWSALLDLFDEAFLDRPFAVNAGMADGSKVDMTTLIARVAEADFFDVVTPAMLESGIGEAVAVLPHRHFRRMADVYKCRAAGVTPERRHASARLLDRILEANRARATVSPSA